MAAQPPPAPTAEPPPASAPGPPSPPPRKRRGCGCGGCGGCLVAILAVVVLVVGGVYLLALREAEAGTPSPATLVVFASKTELRAGGQGYQEASTGQALTGGDSVRTDATGHASIQFPDGSLTRLAPGTELTLSDANLARAGGLHDVSVEQKTGRTYSTVQHLAGGTFRVRGNGVAAEVRGTDFEVYLRPDKTVLVKLFTGKVHVGGPRGAADLAAGQQVVVAANGSVGAPSPIAPEPADPFALEFQGEQAVGGQPGTVATALATAPLAQGQTSTAASYTSTGGDVTTVLSYPGSLMKLTVTDPTGRSFTAQGPPPLKLTVPSGPVGVYHAAATGVSLPAAGELYAISFSSNPPCQAGSLDQNGVVRDVLSNQQLALAIQEFGVGGVAAHIGGPTVGGAPVSASFSAVGISVSGQGIVYSATPNVGLVITGGSVYGVSIGADAAARLAGVGIQKQLASIPLGFTVDRVYACSGVMVIEGHH